MRIVFFYRFESQIPGRNVTSCGCRCNKMSPSRQLSLEYPGLASPVSPESRSVLSSTQPQNSFNLSTESQAKVFSRQAETEGRVHLRFTYSGVCNRDIGNKQDLWGSSTRICAESGIHS